MWSLKQRDHLLFYVILALDGHVLCWYSRQLCKLSSFIFGVYFHVGIHARCLQFVSSWFRHNSARKENKPLL